jgi:hypothetical protein
MYHLAASLFFGFVLVGAGALGGRMLRSYREELLAALFGKMPRRRPARAWTRLVRVTVRPHPVLLWPGVARPLRRAV